MYTFLAHKKNNFNPNDSLPSFIHAIFITLWCIWSIQRKLQRLTHHIVQWLTCHLSRLLKGFILHVLFELIAYLDPLDKLGQKEFRCFVSVLLPIRHNAVAKCPELGTPVRSSIYFHHSHPLTSHCVLQVLRAVPQAYYILNLQDFAIDSVSINFSRNIPFISRSIRHLDKHIKVTTCFIILNTPSWIL